MTAAEKPGNDSISSMEMRLSTRDLPREQQFELWRNVMNEASAPVRLELERPNEGFEAEMLLRSFGTLQLAYTTSNTNTCNRVQYTRAHSEIARTGEHSLVLTCHLAENASLTYAYNDVPRMIEAGSWALINTEDRIAGICHESSARQVMLRIPEETNAPLLRFAGRFFGVLQRPDNMANALVTDYLKTLIHHPMPDAKQAAAIGRHFVDLLALAMNQTPEQFEASQGGVRATLVMAIEREIETHYLDQEFSPARAAANLRITPRYLHKILEPTGMSFSERVIQRRLQHAQALLSAPSATRLGILGVALDSGFRNAEHFSQRFRAAFGMSPREFRDGRIKADRNILYCTGRFATMSAGDA